ncbi:hypothetical protein HPB52_012448 [Rhipicephalus sanguineus]|uniref:Uncharacterized protein n=1 Tax=Rhipicephalus sanguineus TaxID=34632 RepID=A0A9D4Q9N3_RHISA|nr:hypothetical protein HPB52_012448 [Rhipicephalus sanguineus]
MEPIEVTSESDSLLPKEPCVASMSTPPRSVGKNKSGHILNSDSRNMIFHCYTYWRNRVPVRSVEDTSKFVAEMLGVSESTVFKVRREAKASSSSGGNLSTPSRKRPRNAEKRRRSTKYDSFTLCALRSCVHDFFRRNEIPTVEKITNEFSNRMDLPSLKRCTRCVAAASRFSDEAKRSVTDARCSLPSPDNGSEQTHAVQMVHQKSELLLYRPTLKGRPPKCYIRHAEHEDICITALPAIGLWAHQVLSPLAGTTSTHVEDSPAYLTKINDIMVSEEDDATVSFGASSLLARVPVNTAVATYE